MKICQDLYIFKNNQNCYIIMTTQTKLVTITPKAIEKVKEFIESEEKKQDGLRVYVAGGGCSGFSYGLSLENEKAEDDSIIDTDGIKLYIDSASAQYLKGSEIDYIEDVMSSGFKISNPNTSSSCACGHSHAF